MGKKASRKKAGKMTGNHLSSSRVYRVNYSALLRLNSPLVHIILVLVLGFLSYSNTFNVPFQWDDKHFISENPIVKDLNYFLYPERAEGLGMLYEHFKGRYIGYLTFALNYKMNGLNVTGYHVVNYFIHILNSMLVYWLVILIFQTPLLKNSVLQKGSGYIAFFSSLLFVSHPVQTEAVTYIYQRLASLAAFFYLLSVASYARSRLSETKTGRSAFFALSLISAVLGMKTKENTFTIPGTIALFEYLFFLGPAKTRVFRMIPFVPILLIVPLTHIGTDRPIGEIMSNLSSAATNAVGISRWDYLLTQFSVIVTYIRLLFLPINQNLDYHYPLLKSFSDPQAYLSFLFLLASFAFAVYLLYRSKFRPDLRVPAFGIFWFFITLSVESSIIPIQMLIDEYRIYLPSAGFFIAVTYGILLTFEKFRDKKTYRIAVLFLMFVPVVFAFAAHARNSVWSSSISLWEDVVRKSPGNIRAHNNMGNEYMYKGMVNDAIKHYQIALKLNPDNPEIHNNLGNAYMSIGSTDKAIKHYLLSLKLKPDNARIHSNLGNMYMSKGQPDEAIRYYIAALKLKPDYADPRNNLGNAYAAQGLTDEAIKQYKIALELNPDYADPHFNLGLLYLGEGQKDRALKEFETALQLKPDFHKARKYIESIRK